MAGTENGMTLTLTAKAVGAKEVEALAKTVESSMATATQAVQGFAQAASETFAGLGAEVQAGLAPLTEALTALSGETLTGAMDKARELGQALAEAGQELTALLKREAVLRVTADAGEALATIAELQQDTHSSHTVHVKVEREGERSTVGDHVQFASGGVVAFPRRSSAHVREGEGRTDDVPALLMRDEFVLRREAVRRYGLSFLNALNGVRIPTEALPAYAEGGLVTGWGGALSARGQAAASGLMQAFSRQVRGFAEGGSSGDLESQEARIKADYQARIKAAKEAGEAEKAELLGAEQKELLELAASLKAELARLNEEFQAERESLQVERRAAADAFATERAKIEAELAELKRTYGYRSDLPTVGGAGADAVTQKSRELAVRLAEAQEEQRRTLAALVERERAAKAALAEGEVTAQAEHGSAVELLHAETRQGVVRLTKATEETVNALTLKLREALAALREAGSTRIGQVQYLNAGGLVRGRDSVPALLTPGEGVVREPVMRRLGAAWLSRINRLAPALAFSSGGLVPGGALGSAMPPTGNGLDPAERVTLELKIAGGSYPARTDRETARAVVRELRRQGVTATWR